MTTYEAYDEPRNVYDRVLNFFSGVRGIDEPIGLPSHTPIRRAAFEPAPIYPNRRFPDSMVKMIDIRRGPVYIGSVEISLKNWMSSMLGYIFKKDVSPVTKVKVPDNVLDLLSNEELNKLEQSLL